MTEAQIAQYLMGGLGISGIGVVAFHWFLNYLKKSGAINAQIDANKTQYEILNDQIKTLNIQVHELQERLDTIKNSHDEQERHIMVLEMLLDVMGNQYKIDIDDLYRKYGVNRRWTSSV